MKYSLAVFTIFVVLFCIATAYPQKYTSKFDSVNVDAILANDRIVNNYIKCLLDKGACTQEGRELKSKLAYSIVYSV